MLTSVIVVAPGGATIEIKTQPAAADPLVLLGVPTGLEPVAATINTTSYGDSRVKGEFYKGSNTGKRNVVLNIGLPLPGSRDVLYAYFLPENAIKLQFNFVGRDPVYIDGYVETHNPSGRFSESPDFPSMQVSVICPKPNFLSALKTIDDWTGTSRENAPWVDIPYIGNAGGGFFWNLDLAGNDFSSPMEINVELDGNTRRMLFKELDIVAGWEIFISTHPGMKIAEYRPVDPLIIETGADPISILNKMEDTYFWTQFFAGTNRMQVVTPGNGLSKKYTVVYADQFAGI